jgi:hypothetical protein
MKGKYMSRNQRARAQEITGDAVFLVRIGDNFYAGINGSGQVLAIAAPSRAKHMSYHDADAIVQVLLNKGYKNPYVTNLVGEYANLQVIEDEQRRAAERIQKFWGNTGR